MEQVKEVKKESLSELVKRAQAGDIASYEHIVISFQASAFSQAFSILGDSHLAEDAVQDAFIEAYHKLGSLRTPEAFASWFHKVVFTACNRLTRRKTIATASLEEAEKIADMSENPAEWLEREQQEKTVHSAIQSLPDRLRTVTALYYIGGINQREIADYLGLTEASVKKRLFDARKQIKEDITNMAQRISERKAPAERVSARVIAELVSRPQPLLVKEHPIRRILDQIKAALPEYELIESREVEESEIYPSIRESFNIYPSYRLDAKHVLRRQTTGATFRAIKGKPVPIRFLTAGRVFRPDKEDDSHLKVFHQLDGIYVAGDATLDNMKETLEKVISAVLGKVQIEYREAEYGFIDKGMDVYVKDKGKWVDIAGCGMLKPQMLHEAGHDPKQVHGFAFGLGLERLALLKLGLKSVHDLWRPPYITSGL